VRSVLEITRTTTFLKGKQKGQTTRETILYLCTLPPDAARGEDSPPSPHPADDPCKNPPWA
jgi:hypothetical protein